MKMKARLWTVAGFLFAFILWPEAFGWFSLPLLFTLASTWAARVHEIQHGRH